ncbi:hypothetical protein [Pseudaeromonas paramecii]|uniref:Uncharacterized protein n=1 Tax=Pseudaeromonas paramecii TaxID=2138166 RepID=A0ABP8Q0Y8_9GAMM
MTPIELLSLLDKDNVIIQLVLPAIVIIWLMIQAFSWLKIGEMLSLYERVKRWRLQQIESYLANPSSDKTLHATLSDVRDAIYFKTATEIYAEGERRAALLRLFQNLGGCIAWEHIRRSLYYAEFERNEYIYKPFTKVNWAGYVFHYSMAFVSIGFSFFIMIFIAILFATGYRDYGELLQLAAQMLLAFLSGLSYLANNWGFNAAKRIKKELELRGINASGIKNDSPSQSP